MFKLCDKTLVKILFLNILVILFLYGLEFVYVYANSIKNIQYLQNSVSTVDLSLLVKLS
jgi:hypothetical protein